MTDPKHSSSNSSSNSNISIMDKTYRILDENHSVASEGGVRTSPYAEHDIEQCKTVAKRLARSQPGKKFYIALIVSSFVVDGLSEERI